MNCLHHLIEAQSGRTPDADALAFEGARLTYRELERRANALAAHLRGLGAGPEARVALYLERSLEMVVALLAVLKAGAAYVPMDVAFPRERLAFMLSDAGVKLALTQSRLAAKLPAPAQPVCLDEFDWSGAEAPLGDTGVKAQNLAYVIYTSGSTGQPKGVCIEHRNIVHYVRGVAERLQLEPGMAHASVSTLAADLGNTVIFPALATGGCLHVIAQERAESRALFAEYLRANRIDVLKIVPSHLAALQSGAAAEELMPARRLVLGGEASRLEWIERLRAAAPHCAIYNHYGPTETTVGVLTYGVGAELPRTPSLSLPLGKPLPDTQIHLLDPQGHPVPAGEKGEICIGGRGVARGYLNRPELSAERFVRDPFSADPQARMYRTGDLGRMLPEGDIEFCGRGDHQVKIHGFRVELGEIEAALREDDRVQDAVVLLRDEQLVAFVGAKVTGPFFDPPTVPVLRENVKRRLPHYMVPSAIVLLEKLPLTANGKLDRHALAALQVEAQERTTDYVAPRTETERSLAAIWAELLGLDRIGVDDDVFDLGAHSLLAMKALARIREAFGINLVLRNLFEQPTVAQLAPTIDGLASLAAPPARRGGEREEFVL
ncbi:MAG: amino acid adenylation domain-containing protein [Burkholderiales bacterium]